MEKEELVSIVNGELGSTKLTISERTFNEEIEDVLGDFGDDKEVNTAIISRLVKRLKRIDGNLHADVGAENRKYREQFEKDWNEKHPGNQSGRSGNGGTGNGGNGNGGNGEPEWFKRYREEQDAKYKALEDERKEEKARAQKDAVLKQVKDGVDTLFAKAGITPNAYILKQTMRDIDITADSNIDGAIKDVEKAYYRNLKDAGIVEDGKPHKGGDGSSKVASAMWAKKKAREGFGNKG